MQIAICRPFSARSIMTKMSAIRVRFRKCRRVLSFPLVVVLCMLFSSELVHAGDALVKAEGEHPSYSVHLPDCKRDVDTWKQFSPMAHWMDRNVSDWRTNPKEMARFRKHYKSSQRTWIKEDVVDTTWIDIDGDGWCDVITSGDHEPYKEGKGRPVLLSNPHGIYMRTEKGFQPYKPGMITNEYLGSSLTVYWDQVHKEAVLVKRIFQGNLVGVGEDADNAFHFRQMLRAAFSALAEGDKETYYSYFEEAQPFLYDFRLPAEISDRVWQEEAKRAGVEDMFERY